MQINANVPIPETPQLIIVIHPRGCHFMAQSAFKG